MALKRGTAIIVVVVITLVSVFIAELWLNYYADIISYTLGESNIDVIIGNPIYYWISQLPFLLSLTFLFSLIFAFDNKWRTIILVIQAFFIGFFIWLLFDLVLYVLDIKMWNLINVCGGIIFICLLIFYLLRRKGAESS
jgi:hypothetical protein